MRGIRLLAVIAGILAALAFTYTISQYSVNLPYQDDTFDSLDVIVKIDRQSSISGKFSEFYQPHNEHRNSASRLVYLLFVFFQGQLNYDYLALFSYGLLAVFLVSLAISHGSGQFAPEVIAIVFLLFLQPVVGMVVLWATGAFAYFGVVVYGFLCLKLLGKPAGRHNFLAALIFALLATFSLRSGQLIWLLGVPLLLAQSTDRAARISIWLGSACVSLIAYYWNFDEGNNILSTLLEPTEGIASQLYFFVVLLGAGLSMGVPPLAAMIGTLSLGASAYIIHVRSEKSKVHILFSVYTLLLLLAIAYGRGSQFPAELACQSPRYAFLSLAYLSNLILLLIPSAAWNRVKFRCLLILMAVAFNLAVYHLSVDTLIDRQNSRIDDYNNHRIWSFSHPGENAQKIVDEAIGLGLFDPEERPVARFDQYYYTR